MFYTYANLWTQNVWQLQKITFNNLEHNDKVHKTQQTVAKATRSAAAHVCVCVCVCVSEMIRRVSVVDPGVMLIKIIT